MAINVKQPKPRADEVIDETANCCSAWVCLWHKAAC
jgi:hypothetical protein